MYGLNINFLTNSIISFIELFTILSLAIFLRRRFNIKGIIAVFSIVLILIYIAQTVSLFTTHDVITTIALENVQFINHIFSNWQLFLLFLCAASIGISLECYLKKTNVSWKILLACIVILLIGNRIAYTPSYHLIRSYRYKLEMNVPFTYEEALAEYKKQNIDIENEEYPLLKNTIYEKELAYKANGNENIIIFFLDGLSTNLIGAYGCKYPDLTPNLDAFAKNPRVMQVNNYYNHTAPTYRGIQGTLNSGFPLYSSQWTKKSYSEGLSKRSQISIIDILDTKGYESVFIHPHSEKQFNPFLKNIGFQKIFSREKSIKQFADIDKNPINATDLTDEAIFSGLTTYLKQSEPKTKQVIGLYMVGTHAFLGVPEGGKEYSQKDSLPLSRMHNADFWFGKFWEYFKNSPYYENTYVIFTTDHAHFPEIPYVEVAKSPYELHFIDKIPLFIYDPNNKLPKNLDAKNRTSLDFAPTLLHILGYNNEPNAFLGSSLFEDAKWDMNVALIRRDPFIINASGAPRRVKMSEFDEKIKAAINLYHAAEIRNTVAPQKIESKP